MYRLFFLLISILTVQTLSAQQPQLVLPLGHTSRIQNIDFSNDGKHILTCDYSNVKIWEVSSGKLLHTISLGGAILSIGTYGASSKYVLITMDTLIKVLESETGKFLYSIRTKQAYTGRFTGNNKYLVSNFGVWDGATGKPVSTYRSTGYFWPQFSADEKFILTGTDTSIHVLDIATGKILTSLRNLKDTSYAVTFTPDSKFIVTSSHKAAPKLWDRSTGNFIASIGAGAAGPPQFSADGKMMVFQSYASGPVIVASPATGKIIQSIENKMPASTATFSTDSRQLIIGYRNDVHVFDINSGKLLHQKPSETNVQKIIPLAKGLIIRSEKSIDIWNSVTGKLLTLLEKRFEYSEQIEISADGRHIAVNDNNTINIYKASSGKLLNVLRGRSVADKVPGFNTAGEFQTKRIPAIKSAVRNFYNNGYLVIVDEKNVELRDSLTRTLIRSFKTELLDIDMAIVSKGAKHLLIRNKYDDDTLQLFEVATGKLLKTMDQYSSQLVRFSNNGKYLATLERLERDAGDAEYFNTQILNIAEDKIIFNRTEQAKVPVLFSADEKYFIAQPNDTTALIWDAETGKSISIGDQDKIIDRIAVSAKGYIAGQTYYGKNQAAVGIWDMQGKFLHMIPGSMPHGSASNFSKDGKFIVTRAKYGGKVWEVATGKMISELNGNNETLTYVTFSDDGSMIANYGLNYTADIFESSTGKLIRTLPKIEVWTNSIEFSIDNRYLIINKAGGSSLYNISTGKNLTASISGAPEYSRVVFHPENKYIVTSFNDTRTVYWDPKTSEQLFTYIAIDSTSYLVMDKHNRFDGDEAARKLLYFTCASEIIELNQLKEQLWVPNLASRIMKGETINAKSLSELNICGLTPRVDRLRGSSGYHYKITPRRGGLGKTIVYVNGIETKVYEPSSLKKVGDGYELNIPKNEVTQFFATGIENQINVKAYTKNNNISSRSGEPDDDIEIAINTTPPNLYAVVIGVSDYKGDGLDLKYAAKDAGDIVNAVKLSAGKLLGSEHVFIYNLNTGTQRDNIPEKKSIRAVFSDIGKKATANDILLVFFAGHGVVEGSKKNFYLLTADASSATSSGAGLKDVGISSEELMDWMKPTNIKAQKRIMILDACNSGAAINQMVEIGKNKGYVAARNDDKASEIKQIDRLNEKAGLYILSASASDQKAYEIETYSQGVLTYALLKVIKEHPEILEQNKFLNVSSWFNEAVKMVNVIIREHDRRQEPQLITTTNFNIGIVDQEVLAKIVLPNERPLFAASKFLNDEDFDELDVSNAVNHSLNDITSRGTSEISFNSNTESPEAYILSGRYTFVGEEVVLKVNLRQSKERAPRHRFEVRGLKSDVKALAGNVVEKAMRLVK